MKTLILGLGNSILSDDGVGLKVIRLLEGKLDQQEVTVMESNKAGLGLLDLLIDYDKAIIVDAIQTVDGRAGQIYRLDPEAFGDTRHTVSSHDANLAAALKLGNRLGLVLPQQIVIFAIEAADVSTFSEGCTLDVEQAVPFCVKMVIEELSGTNNY